MAESKNSFIQSKMNKDLDERLIPSNVYRDALNVAISRSEGSDVGALEGILGNSVVSSASQMASGTTTGTTTAFKLIDSTQSFVTTVSIGNRVINSVDGSTALVTVVDNNTTLTLDTDIMLTGQVYVIDDATIVIGKFVDEANALVYFFKTNYTGTADILPENTTSYEMNIQVFNSITLTTNVLVQGNFLNFSTQNFIYGINLLENLLFWTDNRNAPRKINVSNNSTYYTNADQISVCKWAPYLSPELINNRSLQTIKPSTMSDASDLSTVAIEGMEITSSNLAVKKYRNGDEIPQAKSLAQWIDNNTAEIGCWCYYDNLLGEGINYGILYNKWAVLDSRQLAPIGYSVLTELQWKTMTSFPAWTGEGTKLKAFGFEYWENALILLTPGASYTVGTKATTVAPLGGVGLTVAITINSDGGITSGEIVAAGSGYVDGEVITIVGAGAGGTFTWTGSIEGTNLNGFNARGGGERVGTAILDFNEIKRLTTYWTNSVTDDNFIKLEFDSADVTLESTAVTDPKLAGRYVRLIKQTGFNGWNGDPEYLTDKFAKFSYRFKFDDNEYSLVAPFSQDVFIPEQGGQFVNDDENQAFITTVVEFMQNSINTAVLNITLPSLNILTDYKIKGIDIIIKESDAQVYSVLESIVVDDNFIADLNNTNVYQYTYQSLVPIKTLTLGQTTRVFDKVPITALAQESSGNRIMYSNFTQGYGTPIGLNYFVDSLDKTVQEYTEYPQHSIKQNRNYQVGIILADKYGRETDIILSNYDDELDALGNPIPGSNLFINYKPLSFSNDVDEWLGDQIRVQFNSPGIPENPSATNTTNTYPGVYAVGNYYEVTVPADPGPYVNGKYFWDLSNQSLTAIAAQTIFDFTSLSFADADDAANSYELYTNEGKGWIKVTGYTIADNAGEVRATLTATTTSSDNDGVGPSTALVLVTANADIAVGMTVTGGGLPVGVTIVTVTDTQNFVLSSSHTIPLDSDLAYTIGATADVVYKFRLLYTASSLNKYETGQYVLGGDPLIADFVTAYPTYFAVNKELRGLYCDYTAIKTVIPKPPLTDPATDPYRAVEIFTTQEVAAKYLFNNTTVLTRPEPVLIVATTFATYDINPRGFYSYRIGIKQQQQDYYNVYLPGIVNGYPLVDDIVERNEIAFTTLISDNINKVPRNLQDVGPLQNQFTSDEQMHGRVVNTLQISDGIAPVYDTFNRQFLPTSSPDTADLVGTIKDAFPDQIATPPAAIVSGDVNPLCIYDYETKPYIAKISTQSAIGVFENLFTTPSTTTTNFPYPAGMSLAVYETVPVTVPFEIYYEASTSALISDLNEAIQGDNTSINGMTIPSINFDENDILGSSITTDIYPTINGTVYTGATGQLISVVNKNTSGEWNTVNFANPDDDSTQRFDEGSDVLGTIFIKSAGTELAYGGTFYAGSAGGDDSLLYGGTFLYTIRWTDSIGSVTTDLTGTFELSNSPPTIPTSPLFPGGLNISSQWIFGNTGTIADSRYDTPTAGGVSFLGRNGSLRNTNTSDFGNWAEFNLTSCWQIIQVTVNDLAGNETTTADAIGIAALFVIELRDRTVGTVVPGVPNNADIECGFNLKVGTTPLALGYRYRITVRLADTLGEYATEIVDFTVPSNSYIDTTKSNPYESSSPTDPTQVGTSTDTTLVGNVSLLEPYWTGQLQNWRNNQIYFYLRLKVSSATDREYMVNIADIFLGNRQGEYPSGDVTLSFFDATMPIITDGSGDEQFYETGLELAAFSATPTMIAQGVRPGQKSPDPVGTLGAYDFDSSAVINLKYSVTQSPYTPGGEGGEQWEAELMYSFSTGDPSSTMYSLGGVVGDNIPPFYSNIVDSLTGSNVAPTATPIGAGPGGS